MAESKRGMGLGPPPLKLQRDRSATRSKGAVQEVRNRGEATARQPSLGNGLAEREPCGRRLVGDQGLEPWTSPV